MRTRLEAVRIIVSAWIVLMAVVVSVPAAAQKLGPDGAPDPDASVVNEQTLLQHAPRIQGRISIPDWRASVLIQPAGREWVTFHGFRANARETCRTRRSGHGRNVSQR